MTAQSSFFVINFYSKDYCMCVCVLDICSDFLCRGEAEYLELHLCRKYGAEVKQQKIPLFNILKPNYSVRVRLMRD